MYNSIGLPVPNCTILFHFTYLTHRLIKMKKVHIISIGGAVMHNIAIQLLAKGYQVTGSDDILFDPSLSRLNDAGLLPEKVGWYPEKITKDLDFVIVGMHARADNPELIKAQALGLTIHSFPSYVRSQSENQTRIVVAGSHGKTTTSSMVVHLLQQMGQCTDHLIGAKMEGVDDIVTLDGCPYFVLEGDEYPSSAIDKRPKFLHYDPDYLILTGIAWDHMNVFPTYEIYFNAFIQLLESLRPECVIIYNGFDREVVRLIKLFDFEHATPYHMLDFEVKEGIFIAEKKHPMKVIGRHNMENLTAAVTLCEHLGFDHEKLLESAETFSGSSRRLELLLESGRGSAFIDFAHAPSKVRASVQAVKELHPDRPMVAVLELHTYSSLNKNFLPEYRNSLDLADQAIVMFDPEIVANKKMEPLQEIDIRRSFGREDIMVVNRKEELSDALDHAFLSYNGGAVDVVLMSSGSFGGLDVKKKLMNLWDL